MTEIPLTGGHNTTEVVRIGETVHRRRGWNAAFVTRTLIHLESTGYAHAPRHRGVDEFGRDVLTFIPGVTSGPSGLAPGAWALAGRMLRELHDLTAGHELAGERECVVHGDPGPFNAIFRAGLPVALIDWDSCAPGDRLDDLGYLAWTWCLQPMDEAPITDQARHLRELRDGYGEVGAETLIAAILRRQTRMAETEEANSRDPRQNAERQRHALWAVEWATAGRGLVERNREQLLAALI